MEATPSCKPDKMPNKPAHLPNKYVLEVNNPCDQKCCPRVSFMDDGRFMQELECFSHWSGSRGCSEVP